MKHWAKGQQKPQAAEKIAEVISREL